MSSLFMISLGRQTYRKESLGGLQWDSLRLWPDWFWKDVHNARVPRRTRRHSTRSDGDLRLNLPLPRARVHDADGVH